MTGPEPVDEPGQHEGRGGLSGGDAEHPRDAAPPLGKGAVQGVHAFHQRHGDPVEAPAGRGEDDTRADPLEQPGPELRLQRAYLLRHGRLAEAEFLGRPGDAPQARHVAEHPELLEAIPFVVETPVVGRRPHDSGSAVKLGSMSPMNVLAASDRRSPARVITP